MSELTPRFSTEVEHGSSMVVVTVTDQLTDRSIVRHLSKTMLEMSNIDFIKLEEDAAKYRLSGVHESERLEFI